MVETWQPFMSGETLRANEWISPTLMYSITVKEGQNAITNCLPLCHILLLHNDTCMLVIFSPALEHYTTHTVKHYTRLICACARWMKIFLASQRSVCPLRISNPLFKINRQVYTNYDLAFQQLTNWDLWLMSVSYTHLVNKFLVLILLSLYSYS